MRTTMEIEDRLLKAAKMKAARETRSLRSVVEDALRAYLSGTHREDKPFRLRLKTKRSRVLPGTDFADRDSLYERMEGA